MVTKSSDIPRVLLLVETSSAYGRRILAGAGRWVREHGPWRLYFQTRGLENRLPPWVSRTLLRVPVRYRIILA